MVAGVANVPAELTWTWASAARVPVSFRLTVPVHEYPAPPTSRVVPAAGAVVLTERVGPVLGG